MLAHLDVPPNLTIPTPLLPPAVDTVGVLHLINGEHYAGAERVQDLLAARLPALGYSVGLACLKLDVFDEMRESRDAPLYDVRMASRFDVRAASRVARLVRKGGYRIIHGHTVRTAFIGSMAAAMTGVPLVYHAHSPTSRDTTRRWTNRINARIERLCLRRVSRVVAVSEAMAEHIRHDGFDPSRIVVVHNGVPALTNLAPRTPPCGRWTLGVVALMRPRKGIEVLLDSLAILRRQGIDVHLRAVGAFESPAYESEITARVRQLELAPHITWTGFTRDVAAELQKMGLLVLPSLFGEGLPMVVLEAMAAGVPVVATGVAGVPEAIRDGQDGLLTAPGDATDLARAIADVVQGRYDWSALRASAMARHAAHFSDHAMASGVADVYHGLLDEQPDTRTTCKPSGYTL